MTTTVTFVLLLLLAFGLNLPLGCMRARTQRYSWQWFVCIHLSIPLIVWARLQFGFGWELIPFTIAAAVLGQVIGSRCQSRPA